MKVSDFFQSSSNILQYVLPTVVGLGDVLPDLQNGKLWQAGKKAILIGSLILIQNRSGMAIKHLTKKPRPCFPNDLESFPSGHMMIAVQSLVRAVHRDGFCSNSSLFVFTGTVFIGLGRYLPGMHDVTDLTGGAILGGLLGYAWNKSI